MKLLWIVTCLHIGMIASNDVEDVDHNVRVSENRLAAQLFAVLDHYKQEDPVGIPGAEIPDPMPVPDIRKSLGIGTLYMKQTKVHGLSKFRIKHVKTDLKELKVNAGVQLDIMTVLGRYVFSSFSSTEGPFTVILKDVFVTGNASLGVERDGRLRTQDINMDITFSDMSMDFQNSGLLGSIFQGFVNSAPTLFFDTTKPFILAEAYTKLRKEIDMNIEKGLGNQRFPNSVAPLDMAIAEARKKVRASGYDPFLIPDYNRTAGIFSMEMSNTYILGLSSFYRIGNTTINMENNVVSVKLQIGTQQLAGFTQWSIGIGKGMIGRSGHAQFTVQHIKATFEVSQPLDVRKRAILTNLQIDLGNIQVRCDGAGTLDYVIEVVVNILPNLLRYQIMDAVEGPIKVRLQEQLNQIDIERTIKENWNTIENMGADMKFDFKF